MRCPEVPWSEYFRYRGLRGAHFERMVALGWRFIQVEVCTVYLATPHIRYLWVYFISSVTLLWCLCFRAQFLPG